MFRSAIARSLRASAPRVAVKTPAPFQIRSSPIAARVPQFTPVFVSQSIRAYSAPAGLNKEEVEGRIVNLLKNFDKVRQIVIRAFFGPHQLSTYDGTFANTVRAGFRCQQGQFSMPRPYPLVLGC